MNRIHKACLCVLLPLLCGAAPGLGQAPVVQDVTDGDDFFDEGPQRPAHSISELDWLAGRWVGQGLGGDVEEMWSPPSAGSMVGMFRLVDDYKTSFCEFLMIEEKDGLVTLRFKHFNSAYESWEKDGPLVLDLTDATHERAVFQSRDPKQSPARVVYGLRGENGLGLLIESPNALGGPISFDVLYRRAN